MKIWGRNNSINVMKVLWACAELGLPFERKDVGGAFGGNDTESYLTMNPNGRVPTIEDQGLVLWESNVIVRYLAHTYGSPGLEPADRNARWLAEQWMDWQQTTLHPPATTLFWGLVRTPPEKRDQIELDTAVQQCGSYWRLVDARLASNPWLAGGEFSMGDIPLGAAVHRWFNLDIERPDLQHLWGWYQRLCERPGFRAHVVDIPIT